MNPMTEVTKISFWLEFLTLEQFNSHLLSANYNTYYQWYIYKEGQNNSWKIPGGVKLCIYYLGPGFIQGFFVRGGN